MEANSGCCFFFLVRTDVLLVLFVDASRPWLLYWMLHSLELLGETINSQEEEEQIVRFLARCVATPHPLNPRLNN